MPSGGKAYIDTPRSLLQKREHSRMRFLISRGTPLQPSTMRVVNFERNASARPTNSPVTRVCLKSNEIIPGAEGVYCEGDTDEHSDDKDEDAGAHDEEMRQ